MDAQYGFFKGIYETSQIDTVLIKCVVVADVYGLSDEEGFSLSHNPIMIGMVFVYYVIHGCVGSAVAIVFMLLSLPFLAENRRHRLVNY